MRVISFIINVFTVYKNGDPISKLFSPSCNDNSGHYHFLTWTLTYDTETSSAWKIYIDGLEVLTSTGYWVLTIDN